MGIRSVPRSNLQFVLSAVANHQSDGGGVAVAELKCDLSRKITSRIKTDEYIDRAWWYSGTLQHGATIILHPTTLSGIDIGAGAGCDILGQPWDIQELTTLLISNKGTGRLLVDFDGEKRKTITPNGMIFRHEPDGITGIGDIRIEALDECKIQLVMFGLNEVPENETSESSIASSHG